MSVQQPEAGRERPAVDAVAGLLASLAIFAGLIAIFYRPVRVAPAAVVLALVAGGMSRRWTKLAAVGVAVAAGGWMLGMALAVATNHPLW